MIDRLNSCTVFTRSGDRPFRAAVALLGLKHVQEESQSQGFFFVPVTSVYHHPARTATPGRTSHAYPQEMWTALSSVTCVLRNRSFAMFSAAFSSGGPLSSFNSFQPVSMHVGGVILRSISLAIIHIPLSSN